MKLRFILFSLTIILLYSNNFFSQVENVPLNHPVYNFLKEMKVKNILLYISDDLPNLSRFQVVKFLKQIEKSKDQLSETEIALLKRYLNEFNDKLDDETTTILFNPDKEFTSTLPEALSDKIKYLYVHKEENASFFLKLVQDFYYGSSLIPDKKASFMYDAGLDIRGTVFNKLGYKFYFVKGGAWDSKSTAEEIKPELMYNFKWNEGADDVKNYDLVEGYVKYHTEPVEDMHLSLQLGKETKTVGYGYGSKLVLSNTHPPMDFIQFNFDYGVFHLSSIHASTVGRFNVDRMDNFTKFWAFNRVTVSIPELFDLGIGESIIYSGRGIEIAYLNPFGWYKFIEHSIQDRDNATLYLDFETSFINNLELQGTFFLDENILFNLGELNRFTNKTAYQIGAFWYEAFTLEDLSLIVEYTRIRPYVYTHFNIKNTYTAYGAILGDPIGPNADEIFTKLAYNVNEKLKLGFVYRHIREGDNIYDDEGNLIKNVGGDVFLTHGENPVNKEAYFLDGIRINHDIFEASFRYEPLRDYIFEFVYNYGIDNNLTKDFKNYSSFAYLKFTLQY